jgi:uncharacterized protein involved in response to NO
MSNPIAGPGRESAPRFALFAYGFRPFFLLAGWYAAASIPVWLWLYRSGISPLQPVPAQLWHGHEMLFGVVAAAIAGFMLTAVPSWTGSRGFAGWPLITLSAIWLFGRLAFALADRIPGALLVVAELTFLPGLLALVAAPLLRSLNRNTPLLFVLTLLWCLDAAFLWAVLHGEAALARNLLLVTLDLVLLLITVIGGRIVPAFTANALRATGRDAALRSERVIERLTIGSMVILVLADLARLPEGLTASVAAFAALMHVLRAVRWKPHATLRHPIVWILHVAYWWLPIGLTLRALHAGGGDFAAHWLHALGIGAAATMVLAVMSRAALGHTGRPLRAPAPVVWSYGLLTAAVLIRVLGPALLPISYLSTITLASVVWTAAFLLFGIAYTPVLIRPRADGRPG